MLTFARVKTVQITVGVPQFSWVVQFLDEFVVVQFFDKLVDVPVVLCDEVPHVHRRL